MNPHCDPKCATEKRLRSLERERNRLWEIERNAPVVPLDVPYQRGWVRWLEWSEQALRRKDAHLFVGLLDVIQRRDWSRSGDFKGYVWRLRRKRYIEHLPREFGAYEFAALKLPKDFWHYFEDHTQRALPFISWMLDQEQFQWRGAVRFRYPEYLVSRVGPCMMTHRKVTLPEVESRLAEIDQIMEQCRGWRKLSRLHGRRGWWHYPTNRQKIHDKISGKEVSEELQQWHEEQGAARSAPFSFVAWWLGEILLAQHRAGRILPGVDLFSERREKEGPKALSVTQLVRRMKNVLEIEVGEVWVEGEISNLKKQASGHWYFSLKDETAQIGCAMFGANRKPGANLLADGAKVRVFAEATLYEARGQVQLVVQKVEALGQGDLQARFEALKRKLQAEGLFDSERKKPLPAFPRVVGIVTSDTGAAIRDILHVLQRRAPWIQPVLYPVRVQGKGAEIEIARAIERMGEPEKYNIPRCDVLIVGRGGGSIEDLWNFNEEVVARAIAACPIPIVSAVGHEIDFTIADFVADLRAPTPSAAAEIVAPDGEELQRRLQQLRRRIARNTEAQIARSALLLENLRRGVMQRGGDRLLREPTQRVDALREHLRDAVDAQLQHARRRIDELTMRHRMHQPLRQIVRREEGLAQTRKRMGRLMDESLRRYESTLERLRGMLRALGPESAFQRGFSITLDAKGQIVRSAADISSGDELRTKLKDGEIRSVVR